MMYHYTNNTEYRQALRDFFNMDISICQQQFDDEMDNETADELAFDAETVERKMNELYETTRNSNAFQTLYSHAAGKMLSLNPEIGLAVLLSYDYFSYFAQVLKRMDETDIELSDCYNLLLEKIK
jgi:hypothetical protein